MIDPAEIAINAAEERDPGNPWVAKMREFYNNNDYLSAKQIASLEKVMPSYIKVEIINQDNFHQHFPHMETSLEPLSDSIMNRFHSKDRFKMIRDIQNGIIQPSLTDICDFEIREEEMHEEERERIELDTGIDIGAYEGSLDESDFF